MNSAPRGESSHDSRYYDDAASLGINSRLSHLARVRNYRHFAETMRPDETVEILDVGTCDAITPEANMLQQMHPHRGRITCTSISEGSAILGAYPGVRHVPIEAGARLPFADAQFDIAFWHLLVSHPRLKIEETGCGGDSPSLALRVLVWSPAFRRNAGGTAWRRNSERANGQAGCKLTIRRAMTPARCAGRRQDSPAPRRHENIHKLPCAPVAPLPSSRPLKARTWPPAP